MIEQSGIVERVEDGAAWVAAEVRSACGQCSQKGCASSLFAEMLGNRKNRLVVADPIGLRPGDAVVVGVPDAVLTQAAVAAYLLPVVALVAAAAAVSALGAGDLFAALAGLAGLALGFWMVRGWSRREGSRQRFAPLLLRRETLSVPMACNLGEKP